LFLGEKTMPFIPTPIAGALTANRIIRDAQKQEKTERYRTPDERYAADAECNEIGGLRALFFGPRSR
jgi:hypothetical protein